MSKKSLLLGAVASIIAINSVFANTIVTSQTYVDNADALKQDKITAGTTGNVVLYNGTQNGQTQFSERAIYDGTNDYDETTDANKLITAGAVNTMAPELPTGNPGYAVLYDENGDIGGERGIDDGGCWWDEGCSMYNDSNDLVALGAIRDNLAWDLSYDSFDGDDALPTAHAVRRFAQERIPAGTTGSVVVYNGIGRSTGYGDGGQTQFTEKAIANAPIINNGTLTNGNDIASINAVQTKQNKMTCTRWLDNAEHTDANCLLWSMAN